MTTEVEQNEDWSDVERDAAAAYPEFPGNPHNHVYTVSMNGQGPMIVVRGNTPQEVNERFQALLDAGVTTLAASVYSHMKAEMNVAQGLGPVSPAPAPQGPPAPPQGAPTPPPFGPNVSVPGAPGYVGPPVPQAPMPPAPPRGQWSGQAAQGGNRGPQPRPADWPSVFKIDVPLQAKDAFKAHREQYKDYFKGKVRWAGAGGYWVHGDVVQAMAAYNPVPA
ncbi:hypothetical protein [Streptomyces formicae]|uniref:Uncharacterized protein n=1 Tax=Streptomyces formicae TaxID=1616117 RepID=A0ABY3WJI0_9ACTN|nr:hypothetical protein [Streptomyces formicae]UNM12295.1 hypothetical protein J4032_12820 [Streptomyces formicae]